MDLENNWEKQVIAAQGYSELGMFSEAINELEMLPSALRKHPDVLSTRLYVEMQARVWESAVATARLLCEAAPDRTIGFIHAAFCLHELGRTAEAKQILLAAPIEIRKEPTFHYNLGCYEAILGNLEAAQEHLHRSFDMDRKFRGLAKYDPDLAALRNLL